MSTLFPLFLICFLSETTSTRQLKEKLNLTNPVILAWVNHVKPLSLEYISLEYKYFFSDFYLFPFERWQHDLCNLVSKTLRLGPTWSPLCPPGSCLWRALDWSTLWSGKVWPHFTLCVSGTGNYCWRLATDIWAGSSSI